jgi:arginine decarboxylase
MTLNETSGQVAAPALGTTLTNVVRGRTDSWNRMRDAARRLRRIAREDPEAERLRAICTEACNFLRTIERYHAFPGERALMQVREHFQRGAYEPFAHQTVRLVRLLTTGGFRRVDLSVSRMKDYTDLLNVSGVSAAVHEAIPKETRPYFEVLVVDDLTQRESAELQLRMLDLRRADDAFIYSVVTVSTFEDALLAVLVNPDIQACVLRSNFAYRAPGARELLDAVYQILQQNPERLEIPMASERGLILGDCLARLRPEMDLYLMTDAPVEQVAGAPSRSFRRVFYYQEDYHDLHLSVVKGIHERFDTPFFSALRRYSQKPTGVFHALPISRGSSIRNSHWIGDMERFYGRNIFQAETSATTGGLDSLLQPHGPLKKAQERAAHAFGARETFFVTNGTSTANKIVLQALIEPGDIVLVAHDCHKSHHYAVILAGAQPIYLDGYPLNEYSMYGAIPLSRIKEVLLTLRAEGKLERVKMLLLTNITFDGVTYDPERVMEEVLANKPHMIFVWDEAWFAYGRFSPTLRRRTAMAAANRIRELLRSEEYRTRYATWREQFDKVAGDDRAWIDRRLRPDPDRARVRVYATHSTHKTLTSLRQGSMIHVSDDEFERRVESVFHEAYMTHTSTSPNYQILASLDIGRRQVELEGFEMVQRSIELAMVLRERIRSEPLLERYFRVLGPREMVPEGYRPSGIEAYFEPDRGFSRMEEAWQADEFVLDPTRITVHVGRTGMDGDTFKGMLMDRFDIQVNKTSRNTVLFMTHIGMTRGTVAHLVKALTLIAEDLDDRLEHMGPAGRRLHDARVRSLTEELPPLPDFSRFHRAFRPGATAEGDVRRAFFLAYNDAQCDYVKLEPALAARVASGEEVVSASFVTPYPPGFPILMPGQVMTSQILAFLDALDVKEIHGYDPVFGLRVFRPEALAAPAPAGPAPLRPATRKEGAPT